MSFRKSKIEKKQVDITLDNAKQLEDFKKSLRASKISTSDEGIDDKKVDELNEKILSTKLRLNREEEAGRHEDCDTSVF